MSATTFDPTHKGANAVLSNGNRDCAPTDAQNGCRVTNGYNAAGGLALYYELQCTATSAFGANFPGTGLSPSTDTFDGNGLNGVAATMTGGYSAFDNAAGTFVQSHGGATAGIAHTGNFGAGAVGTAIGHVWTTAAGTLAIYSIDGIASSRTLICTITGIPTTGLFYPCYGTGGAAPVTEAYRWNSSNAQFHMAKPAGTTAYEDAITSPGTASFFALF